MPESENSSQELIPRPPTDIHRSVDDLTVQLATFLKSFGLPANVLVPVHERRRVINNLPDVIEPLPPEIRRESVYISKFVAACASGLFDAALNFLWDETVANLREKVARYDAHGGWDNFHSEPSHARTLAHYIPDTGAVPAAVRDDYVKTLVMCRIGNGYGVSWAATPTYDELIDLFQEPEIRCFVLLIRDREVSSRLQFSSCATKFFGIAEDLRPRTVKRRTIKVLDTILDATPQQLPKLRTDTRVARDLTALADTATN